MGITINGLETRFQKPRGGENPFKSAKPFDDNIDYNSLEDGDLFYIEQKEGWKECAPDRCIITKVSPEVLNDPYVDYLHVIADESGEITYYSYQDYYLLDNSPMNTESIPSHESWTILIDSIKPWVYYDGRNYTCGFCILPYNYEELEIDITKFPSDLSYISTKQEILDLKTKCLVWEMAHFSESFTNTVREQDFFIFGKIPFSVTLWWYPRDPELRRLDINSAALGESDNYWYIPTFYCSAKELNNFILDNGTLCYIPGTALKLSQVDASYLQLDDHVINYDEYFASDNFSLVWDMSDWMVGKYRKVVEAWESYKQYYTYYNPSKQYIIYSQGVFTLLEGPEHIVPTNTYLKIVEAIDNLEDSEQTTLTIPKCDLFSLFNLKCTGRYYKLSPKYLGTYGYCEFGAQLACTVSWLDQDTVAIDLVGQGSSASSASSQELQIGEFEE